MATILNIDPVTRIEGHLGVRVELEDRRVARAFSSGEMFRGFEVILRGRDPLDAHYITQRICGVCPVSHGTASVLAQDEAYGVTLPPNGWLVRNLILGANTIQSHILHFYHLSALDFVDVTAIAKYEGGDPLLKGVKSWVLSELASRSLHPAAPFLPRYEGQYIEDTELNVMGLKHYLEALDMRALAHKMCALFAGKMPHVATLVPGGVTEQVTAHKIAAYGAMLDQLRAFIDNAYIPDLLAVAKAFPGYFEIGRGCGNFLAYGVFQESESPAERFLPAGALIGGELEPFDSRRITEDVGSSRFESGSGLPPSKGETLPSPHKSGAYSWLKAPRYGGKVMEVGPLARMLIAEATGKLPAVNELIDQVLAATGCTRDHLVSVLGRHAARAIECKLVADRCARWLDQLRPGERTSVDFEIPKEAAGVGLTEAPRGALGHWLEIRDVKISNYQCVVPTTWNCSPRDDRGQPGAVEQALVGTEIADPENPIEAARVVRSFDPCIACAVH
ncbi:MAG: nickel-dependent hydrogenase large subunit [Planctomycetota bacterium]